jgi:hypothetical protein
VFVLANTPYSLCHAFAESDVVYRLIAECSVTEMERYYDKITARARRTELEVALGYALLIAILSSETPHGELDSSRLRWGNDIEDFLMKSGRATQSLIIEASTPRPVISEQQDTRVASGLIIRPV